MTSIFHDDRLVAGESAAPAVTGRAWRVGGVLVVAVFLLESVVAKAGLPGLTVPTPVHILLTAFLGVSVTLLAMAGDKAALPVTVRLLFVILFTLAIVSSVQAENFAVFNTIFSVVWVIHFVAIWWGAPRLLSRLDYASRAGLVLIVDPDERHAEFLVGIRT